MKQVEMVRQRLVTGLGGELRRIKIWLSMTDNADATERLAGSNGDDLLAIVVEATMEHLGHKTAITSANGHSGQADARRPQARKATTGMM